jgi:hypothetical protein
MIPQVTLREALADPALLGGTLLGDSWRTWRIMLMCIMGEELTEDELATYTALTGRLTSPDKPVAEAVLAVGRRGGKSRALSVLTAYIAALCQHPNLAKGEKAVALMVAGDRDQATVDLDYASAVIGESPVLDQMIVSRVADELMLSNGTRTSSSRCRKPAFGWCIGSQIANPNSWRGWTIFNTIRRAQSRGQSFSLGPGSSLMTRRASWVGSCEGCQP